MTFLFGTVGSPISTPKKPGGSVGAILQTKVLGLTSFELGWVQSIRVTEATCAAIKQAALENNIALSVHASYFINLNTTAEQWPAHKKRLWDACYYGYLAGATDIIFHPGSYAGLSDGTPLATAISRLHEMTELLKAENVNVTLRPEVMGKASMLGSLEDVIAMSKASDMVQPCLDISHLFARDRGEVLTNRKAFIDVLKRYRNGLGKDSLRKLHIHISGIEYSAGGERRHLPLDESEFTYKAFLDALNEMKCEGRMMCESPIMEEDAVKLRDYWQSL